MDVTSPGGVSGEQAGAGGRDVGQEEPALHLRVGPAGPAPGAVSAALSLACTEMGCSDGNWL